jgi:glycosyltransferase involved in cell wall biosynthesis
VLVLSAQWAEFVANFSPTADVCVLPNPVKLMPVANQAVVEQKLLFLGRVEKNKGIDELLEAVALLKPAFFNIKLAIGGEGDLDRVKQKAEALGIQNHIELLGWLTPEKKYQHLQQASIFVLPSYEEGLPMAMLEAMSMAKAVVVTAVGGIPSVVEHDVNGLLIPPRDVAALADALSKLLSNKTLQEELGSHARAIIASHYASPVVADKLSAIYDSLNTQAEYA